MGTENRDRKLIFNIDSKRKLGGVQEVIPWRTASYNGRGVGVGCGEKS